ncbi:unnamed protein product [Trichobilharzia szidati]|nr:unnamed protein product [Trichobilharzia szidati]
MSSDEISVKSKAVIESSKLELHEGEVPDSLWHERIQIYLDTCTDIKNILTHQPSVEYYAPPVSTLILLGGILGNVYTTGKLHNNNNLNLLANEILHILMNKCRVETIRKLLLLEPSHQSKKLNSSSSSSSPTNLASQILKLCVIHITKASDKSSDDPLTRAPLFRDTLIWLTIEQLDYPELAGDEFISVLQPLGLRLTEDYRPCIQLAGLKLLYNLACKARIADWRQSSRAEAVIFQLLNHRIASSPDSSEILLDEVYSTLLVLTNLLDKARSFHWYDKITERLLFDLLMESRYKRQIVLLKHLLKLMNILKASFSLYTEQFLKIVSSILLGPRKFKHTITSKTDQSDEYDTVYVLVLQSVTEFIQLCWPIISPTLLPELIPPLIAFIDLLSYDNHPLAGEPSEVYSPLIKGIFKHLILLESNLMSDVLQPLCSKIPQLKFYLPTGG